MEVEDEDDCAERGAGVEGEERITTVSTDGRLLLPDDERSRDLPACVVSVEKKVIDSLIKHNTLHTHTHAKTHMHTQ